MLRHQGFSACPGGLDRRSSGVRDFQFATAGRIEFGAGQATQIGRYARELCGPEGRGGSRPPQRAVFVTGRRPERVQSIQDELSERGFECVLIPITGEPSVDDILAASKQARETGCELVVAVGGGSALDAGKAIAGLATNPGPVLDYLEVVGAGRPLTERPLPLLAVPTTAGTGSEVTRNAVLKAGDVKVSLRSPLLLPAVAVIDPLLTLSMTASVTADCGLDALTQVIEPLVSCRANPLTDGFCREGIFRAARSLARACEQPDDVAARTDLCVTSLCGGLALANAGLGAVHGFAGPIGGQFAAPHGAVCARLLPFVCEVNVRALLRKENAESQAALERYSEVARLLTARPDARFEDGVRFLRELCAELGVQPLRAFGIETRHIPDLLAKSRRASSMRGNPIELSDDELSEILERAL